MEETQDGYTVQWSTDGSCVVLGGGKRLLLQGGQYVAFVEDMSDTDLPTACELVLKDALMPNIKELLREVQPPELRERLRAAILAEVNEQANSNFMDGYDGNGDTHYVDPANIQED